jgi:plastocyanin
MSRVLGVCCIAALLLAGSAQAAKPKPTRLTASVGPGFTITLKKGRAKVKTLKPGAYLIRVSDRSSFHNFHITGRGVNRATTVAFVGNRSFRVTLRRGTYRYRCDPHRLQMKGSFRVR